MPRESSAVHAAGQKASQEPSSTPAPASASGRIRAARRMSMSSDSNDEDDYDERDSAGRLGRPSAPMKTQQKAVDDDADADGRREGRRSEERAELSARQRQERRRTDYLVGVLLLLVVVLLWTGESFGLVRLLMPLPAQRSSTSGLTQLSPSSSSSHSHTP